MSLGQQEAVEEFVSGRAVLLETLVAKPSGLDWCLSLTSLVDKLLQRLYNELATSLGEPPPLTIVATGGYGRRELSPKSDIDLTLVPVSEAHPLVERSVKTLFVAMQESIARGTGLKVGYALRYPLDAPGLDAKTRSGLLDSRVVAGPAQPYSDLMQLLWERFPVAEFVIEKISETESNWRKTNDSPLVVQPDLKVGAGGLRSFQTANWIRAALGERMDRPSNAYDQVVACRNVLHFVSDRLTDKLTVEKRIDVARVFRKEPHEFGSQLAEHLLALQESYADALECIQEARFALAPHVESIRGEARIGALATAGNAALGIANATLLGLKVSDAKAHPSPDAEPSEAIKAITSGEGTIRNLDRSGVLDSLLPELTACKTLMPVDRSHEYTVFEHTMRVVRKLDAVERHPFFAGVAYDLRDKGPLYLAALLHDTGRIEDEARHAEVSEQIAERVCERLGLYDATKETVCWLVREHLSFDRTLRLRDLSDPRTASEFASHVRTPERLAMLVLLTWADVSAVSDDTWTLTHEALTQELFTRTLAALGSDAVQEVDGKAQRKRLLKGSKDTARSTADFETFLESLPAHYLLATDPATASTHFEMSHRASQGEPSIAVSTIKELDATEITVCASDYTGLLSDVLGVLYANDLSISAVRAATTSGESPVAIDTFQVTQGGRPITPSAKSKVTKDLIAVLRRERNVKALLVESKKDPERRQQILTVKFVPGNPGIVEVIAPRGRGLAFRLSRQLTSQGIEIVGTRVSQWAGQGAAAFYVVGPRGAPVDESLVTRALTEQ